MIVDDDRICTTTDVANVVDHGVAIDTDTSVAIVDLVLRASLLVHALLVAHDLVRSTQEASCRGQHSTVRDTSLSRNTGSARASGTYASQTSLRGRREAISCNDRTSALDSVHSQKLVRQT